MHTAQHTLAIAHGACTQSVGCRLSSFECYMISIALRAPQLAPWTLGCIDCKFLEAIYIVPVPQYPAHCSQRYYVKLVSHMCMCVQRKCQHNHCTMHNALYSSTLMFYVGAVIAKYVVLTSHQKDH
eukprot:7769-Heterococcus_DN1.PRE.8